MNNCTYFSDVSTECTSKWTEEEYEVAKTLIALHEQKFNTSSFVKSDIRTPDTPTKTIPNNAEPK